MGCFPARHVSLFQFRIHVHRLVCLHDIAPVRMRFERRCKGRTFAWSMSTHTSTSAATAASNPLLLRPRVRLLPLSLRSAQAGARSCGVQRRWCVSHHVGAHVSTPSHVWSNGEAGRTGREDTREGSKEEVESTKKYVRLPRMVITQFNSTYGGYVYGFHGNGRNGREEKGIREDGTRHTMDG